MSYLKESADDGAIITQSNSGDAYMWILEWPSLDKFLTLISWHEGYDDYQLLNLEGSAYKILELKIHGA